MGEGPIRLLAREATLGREKTYGNRHINTDLSGLDVLDKARRGGTGAGEDGSTVAILVLVDEVDGVIEGLDVQANEDGPEDLLFVALHVRLNVCDDGRTDLVESALDLLYSIAGWSFAYEVAVGVLLGLEAATIEQDGGALLLSA